MVDLFHLLFEQYKQNVFRVQFDLFIELKRPGQI